MDREEWSGPYEHDGKGCPVKGCWVRVVRRNGETDEFKAWSRTICPDGSMLEGVNPNFINVWIYPDPRKAKRNVSREIIRYWVKKTTSFSMLEEQVKSGRLLEKEEV